MIRIQKLVLNKALRDSVFAREVLNKLPNSSFEGDGSLLANIIKQHYQSSSETLDEKTFTTLVENKFIRRNKSEDEITEAMKLASSLYDVDSGDGSEVLSEEISRFVKKELTLDTLQKAIVKEGSLEDEAVLEKLSKDLKEIAVLDVDGKSDGSFIDFFNDTEAKKEAYKNMRRDTLPTGLGALDDILDGGGLGKGEVMLLIAMTGYGKTAVSTQLAINSVKRGKNTLYVTLEENMGRMLMRLETNLTKINSRELFDDVGLLNEDVYHGIQDFYKKKPLLGNLYVSKHNPQEVTIDRLEQIIVDTTVRKGIKLDQVIIDYPSLMKLPPNSDRLEAEGVLFEEIRGLAQKYEFVCITLEQANRGAWNAERVTSYNVEGSKRKLNACELVLSLNRTSKEFDHGYMRLHVDKNRNPRYGANRPTQQVDLPFKVEQGSFNIVDVTEDEAHEHQALLKESEGFETKEDGFQKATKKVNDINSKIGGA